MRWSNEYFTGKYERAQAKLNQYKKPHRWFAWYPVSINKQFVWLEYVYRQYEFSYMKSYMSVEVPWSPLSSSYYHLGDPTYAVVRV